MKACPKCGSLAHFNTYFGAYICSKCDWRDDTFNLERAELNKNIPKECKNVVGFDEKCS
jgi:DNA-directed RNA polymerase subunit M/transcription elongation factor TFIIS